MTMASRVLYLITSRQSYAQRAHFAIFAPSADDTDRGTLIEVVGAPMVGYSLEIKHGYNVTDNAQPYTLVPLGEMSEMHISASTDNPHDNMLGRKGGLEVAAAQIPPPIGSENFMAPVNDVGEPRTIGP